MRKKSYINAIIRWTPYLYLDKNSVLWLRDDICVQCLTECAWS